MSAQVDVLAVLDRQLRDRAERANRYRKNAEKSARKSGEPQITADRMAAYTDLQLAELKAARAAVAALIAERDALRALVAAADKAKRAYWLARNSAAGLTNYCEESANSRRCERELDEAERIYRDSGFEAALTSAQGVQS